ncbi:MAG: alpha/beta hydrolase [Gammaproteobacteria bacterium]|nr:alpha/beta hydrolase [Gammaproteobacteria bacterium]
MTQRTQQFRLTAAAALPVFAPNQTQENIYLQATDGAVSHAILYRPPDDPDTKVCIYVMHPRGPMSRHYLAGYMPPRGLALFGHDSRYLNNDTDCLHEKLLLDIAAGMRRLRDLGFETIVGVGNSGGGSLFGYYQEQAEQSPGERRNAAPSGDRVSLPDTEMPPFDLYVALAAHPGQGNYLQQALDPSIVDERDPESWNPELDMFNDANGYRPWPDESTYDSDWLARYRDAQRQRSLRLDAIAREAIAGRALARTLEAGPQFSDLGSADRQRTRRRSRLAKYMVIYRTLANPAYLDPAIDPSNRPIGSIFSAGRDPIDTNYGMGGLSRIMTPRGWLSTWSGTSSYANLYETIRGVTVPTLILEADGDMDIYPAQQQRMFENAGATDKTLQTLANADHYLNPVGEEADQHAPPRERAADQIDAWVRERL